MTDSTRDRDIALENYQHYAYARDNGHLKYIKKANECRRFFLGNHWDEAQRAILEAHGRPVLTINKVFSTMMTIMGEQIATQADISFQPSATGNQETADALTKLWLNIARENNLGWVEEQVFDSGAVTSRGFYDVRMSFDDHMRGEVDIRYASAKNVLIDPDADEYDPSTWSETFFTKWINLNRAAMMWGPEVAAMLKAKNRSSFEFGYDSIDSLPSAFGHEDSMVRYYQGHNPGITDEQLRRRYRVVERQFKEIRTRPHFVDIETGDTRVVPDTWERERIGFVAQQYGLAIIDRPVEQIRWRQSIDDILVFDEWSPYNRFTQIPYFPIFFEGETIGLVENLLSPQEQLNKVSSQELHIVNTTANSGWKVRSGSLQNMDSYELEQRGAETGIVIELTDVKDLEKLQPNQVPTGLDRIAYKSDEFIKDLSGISDSQRGFDRADVAAKAIRAKQQAGAVNLTKPFRNLLHTRHMLADTVLDLVQTFYTEERIIRVTGGGLLAQSEEIRLNSSTPEGNVVNDLQAGEYTVVVTDVPKRESFEEGQFDEATRLRELGVNIPDHILVESSQLANKAEVAQSIREANGDAEPTEIQNEIAQLEMEKLRLENANAAATEMKTKAAAALQLVKAQGEALAQGENSEAEKAVIEAEKVRAGILLDQERLRAEIQLKREELRETMRLKRQEAQEKIRLERALAEERVLIMRQEAEVRAETERARATAVAAKPAAKSTSKSK